MAEDVRALLDHLGIARADVMGYSMGARITANLALAHPKRLRSAIFGGLGIRLVSGGGLPSNVVRALEAPSIDEVADPQGFMFRRFAEQTKSDLRALAACARAGAGPLPREQVASLTIPALIAVGTKDTIAGSPQELAQLLPGGAGSRDPRSRPHAGRGRQGLQGGGAGLSPPTGVTADAASVAIYRIMNCRLERQ